MNCLYYLVNALDKSLYREVVYSADGNFWISDEQPLLVEIDPTLIMGDYFNIGEKFIYTFYNEKESEREQ